MTEQLEESNVPISTDAWLGKAVGGLLDVLEGLGTHG